uniref:Eukaryotic translation initiation factor 2b, epsilon subunit, putative n=1 Tax=Arundo donax TaxID=35708 RepID=A0A0A9FV04_ARUDO
MAHEQIVPLSFSNRLEQNCIALMYKLTGETTQNRILHSSRLQKEFKYYLQVLFLFFVLFFSFLEPLNKSLRLLNKDLIRLISMFFLFCPSQNCIFTHNLLIIEEWQDL